MAYTDDQNIQNIYALLDPLLKLVQSSQQAIEPSEKKQKQPCPKKKTALRSIKNKNIQKNKKKQPKQKKIESKTTDTTALTIDNFV